MPIPARTLVDLDLGLSFSIFEPYSNLSPAQKASVEMGVAAPEPVFHERGVRLYNGDALELLKRAKSESFDLIFADPPYFLSSGGITCQNGQMVSVDKGDWDKSATSAQIHEFNTQWLAQCHRLLKPDGALWVSGTSHNIYSVGFALQTLGFKILNDIAWQKTNPPPHLACRYFTHAHETLLWARKTPKAKHYFDYAAMKHDNGDKQMQSVWKLPAPSKWEKRFGKHPTQKPEILLDRIIRASSRPGDLILDPFCGSGTSGVVAARLNRRFVGFDIKMEFLRLAGKRLHDELLSTQLIFPFDEDQHTVRREEALFRLKALEGRCLVELARELGQKIFHEREQEGTYRRTLNKGWAALTLHQFLGLPTNTRRIPNGGSWELKQVVVKQNMATGQMTTKETMQITMFDHTHIVEHAFESSHLLHKIARMILVARLWVDATETSSPIILVRPADLSLEIPSVYEQVRHDYEEIRAHLQKGGSPESQMGRLIQSRTKGTGHGSITRAWYARTDLVNQLLGIGLK